MKKVLLSLTPEQIFSNPLLNKGSAFTDTERDAFHLHGRLPYHVSTIQEQIARRYANFCTRPDPLSKYIFLTALQNRNEILFYRLVLEHLEEMLPLIYTPTVGEASQHFSVLYHESRGLYLNYSLKDKIPEIISRLPREIDIAVVTDGERILGLGDLGIGGMAIPLGKLSLYTLFGGIHPQRTLPIMLDVGTNNPALLHDPLYLGWPHPRVGSAEYNEFIEVFVSALKKRYPHVLLQWEDFGRANAEPLLERYRDQICSFNDDIQGTASTVLAAILTSVCVNKSSLKEQKIAVLGAGSAGLGICRAIVRAMQQEGISEAQAKKKFFLVDTHGLVHSAIREATPGQKEFAHPIEELSNWQIQDPKHISLLEVVHHVKPTILIGVSAQMGAFTEEIVRTMACHQQRPIILPLSNPITKSEAHPRNLVEWTEGRAMIATGSPFERFSFKGKNWSIAQCNNVYIFPGVGLGVIAAGAKKVTDSMFLKAAQILSSHAPILKDPEGALFPHFNSLREVSYRIALGVAMVAQEEGSAPQLSSEQIQAKLDEIIWYPEYPMYLIEPE